MPAFNFIYKSNEVAALESPPGETTTQVMALGHPPGDHRDTRVQLQAPRYGLGPYLALGHTLVDDRWYELLRPPQSYWWAAVGEPPSDLEKSGPLKIPTRVRLLKNTLHTNLHLGFWDLKFCCRDCMKRESNVLNQLVRFEPACMRSCPSGCMSHVGSWPCPRRPVCSLLSSDNPRATPC